VSHSVVPVLCIGLLKDSLRKYWLEQIRGMEAAKAVNKAPREQADIDNVCTLSFHYTRDIHKFCPRSN